MPHEGCSIAESDKMSAIFSVNCHSQFVKGDALPTNYNRRQLRSHMYCTLTAMDANWHQSCHVLTKQNIYIHSAVVQSSKSSLWIAYDNSCLAMASGSN